MGQLPPLDQPSDGQIDDSIIEPGEVTSQSVLENTRHSASEEAQRAAVSFSDEGSIFPCPRDSHKQPDHPVVPAFTFASERPAAQKRQTKGASSTSRKRKRSVSPSPERFTLSEPKRPNSQPINKFRGTIGSKRAEEALEFAKRIETCVIKSRNTYRHIFWTDASLVHRHCAAGAVAWRKPPLWEWTTEGIPFPLLTASSDVVEIFAIIHALKLAVDEVKQANDAVAKGFETSMVHEVYVLTDSVGALEGIEREVRGKHKAGICVQVHKVIDLSIELDRLGARLELHLVPGHKGVPGNSEAHRAAKEAADKAAEGAGVRSIEDAVMWYEEQYRITAPPAKGFTCSNSTPSRPSPKKSEQLPARPKAPLPASLSTRLAKTPAAPETIVPTSGSSGRKRHKASASSSMSRPNRSPEPPKIRQPASTNLDSHTTGRLSPVSFSATSFTDMTFGKTAHTFTAGFTPVNVNPMLSTDSVAKASSAAVSVPGSTGDHRFAPADGRLDNTPHSMSTARESTELAREPEAPIGVASSATHGSDEAMDTVMVSAPALPSEFVPDSTQSQ